MTDEAKRKTSYEPNLLAYQPDTGVALPSHIMEEGDLSPLSGWLLMKLLYWAKTRPRFHVNVNGLYALMKECQIAPGKPAIRTAIQELESKALLIRGQRRREDGKLSSDTVYIAVTAVSSYDAIVADLEAANILVTTPRPEFIETYSGAQQVIVTGMERRTLKVSQNGNSTFLDNEETPGHNPRAEFCTSVVTCGNTEIEEPAVENEGKTSVNTVETQTPHEIENCGETQRVPRSQPTCSFSDVGYSNANSINRLNTIRTNCLNTHPSDSKPYFGDAHAEEIAPSASSPSPDLPATSGRTDGLIEGDSGQAQHRRNWVDDPEILSTVVALCANAVNRNKLTASSDRQALAESVGALVEDGYAIKEIIEAWAAAQRLCEQEGCEVKYYPQLLRWLNEGARLQIDRRRKASSKKKPDGKRPGWLDRTIRYNALLSVDSKFAELVEEFHQLKQAQQYGCAPADKVSHAKEKVDAYFAEHEAEVA